VSIAENLGYMIVNDTRVAGVARMIPRAEYERMLKTKKPEGSEPATGLPWAVQLTEFLSPLGVPCQAPPYGTISAIDLATRKIVWQVPLGTTQDSGPLGIATHLPVPIGMPTRGGPLTTSSGLIFIGASQDLNMRALDVRTGRQLWTARMPVGAEATPMTYMSPRSSRQFVVISAGGNSATKQKGDYVIAYALPK
jgi:quinate dehydrogenase (quinone)